MKKFIALLLIFTLVFAGCSGKEEKTFPTDEEIMEKMTPYLTNAQEQDPSLYPSYDDFLKANLGIGEDQVTDAVLYMGAPNQNTTFFLMLTKAESGDTDTIIQALENKAVSMVETASMGYTQGYTEYKIIDKGEKIFLVMHEDQKSFEEMVEWLESL